MTVQTVVFTPDTTMDTDAALMHIANLLPANVISHLDQTMTDGHRTTTKSANGNTHTVTTTWSNTTSMETYKTLMAIVTSGVKSQLATDGWTITFTPETADL